MTHGRKDLVPGEIEPELLARLMALPRKRNVKGQLSANRKAGRKGREGILAATPVHRSKGAAPDKSDDNR